jgi:hypothetical protein
MISEAIFLFFVICDFLGAWIFNSLSRVTKGRPLRLGSLKRKDRPYEIPLSSAPFPLALETENSS